MQDQELKQVEKLREDNKALREDNDKLRDELFTLKHHRNYSNDPKPQTSTSQENFRPPYTPQSYHRVESEQTYKPPVPLSHAKEAKESNQNEKNYANPVRTSIESVPAPSPSQNLQRKMDLDDLNNIAHAGQAPMPGSDPLTNFKKYLAGDQQNVGSREASGERKPYEADKYKALESYKAQHARIGNSTYDEVPKVPPYFQTDTEKKITGHEDGHYQNCEQPPASDFYKRGMEPGNQGFDYKPKNTDIEITDVDKSEKKTETRDRPETQYSRDYSGITSFTNDC